MPCIRHQCKSALMLLTSLFWLLGSSSSDPAALQAKGGVNLSCTPRRLLHLLHMSFHQLCWNLFTNARKLLCKHKKDISILKNNNKNKHLHSSFRPEVHQNNTLKQFYPKTKTSSVFIF